MTKRFYSAYDMAKKVQSRECTALELVEHVLAGIDGSEPTIGAYITVLSDYARQKAMDVDKQLDNGDRLSPLAGVPIGIKDNLCLKGYPNTCASKMLEHFEAPYTATAVQRIIDAGMIPIGKCNLDEFAMGSSTEHSALQKTSNPWDHQRVPGGSSGGSAATVASGQVPISLGSDTGGSIRQPASFCGIVGCKPSYGRISRYGLVAFASSLDQIGPFAHTVEEVAELLTILCGHDVRDATSLQVPVPTFKEACKRGIKGMKIAVPNELMGDTIRNDVRQEIENAFDILRQEGAIIDRVSMPSINIGLASYYVIAPAEASSNLARFDGVRYTYRSANAESLHEMMVTTRTEAFGEEVKRRIVLGTFVLSAGYYDSYYVKAQKARTIIKEEFDRIFLEYDVVMSPTTPEPAFKRGEKSDDPMTMYATDIATIPANMAGLPALSIPCGFCDELPIGLQLVGKYLDEETLLKLGYHFQQVTQFHQQYPESS